MHSITERLIVWAVVVAFILLIPLVAMQFTEEVNWNLADFVVAGILLFGTGLTYEFFARKEGTVAYRVAVGIVIAVVFLLIWMELAAGIFGSPWAEF